MNTNKFFTNLIAASTIGIGVLLAGRTAYEIYRLESADDPDCVAAFNYAETTRCIVSYERSFFRPVTDALPPSALAAKTMQSMRAAFRCVRLATIDSRGIFPLHHKLF